MTCKRISTLALLAATLGACGNYSNEDLEFMNAVPARVDIAAEMPRALMPANEAELAKLTHGVITTFNGALNFLDGADLIRSFQPTSRIPNGRVWGPVPMDDHPGWQWRFIVLRDPAAPEMFTYAFQVQPVGSNANDPTMWIDFVSGSFAASSGARKGVGHFLMQTDKLREAGFTVGTNEKGEMLKSLDVMYWTAAFPVSVTMQLKLYPPDAATTGYTTYGIIDYHYEQQEGGAGLMTFSGTDSASGAMISVLSQWMASGRGRADATATDGTVSGTRTECWDDSFAETYGYIPWPDAAMPGVTPPIIQGVPTLCPVFSAP
jgi:hypothetical protein